MRDQINRDEECSEEARRLLAMRAEMSRLVVDREKLGDREPIIVDGFFVPRRPPTPKTIALGR